MEMQKNFRTAFNGFNREDVVQYISYLNSKHTAEITQLNSEMDFLRKKAEDKPAQPEQAETMEQQADRIRELFDRNKALEEELAQAKEKIAQLESEAQAQKEAPKTSACMEAELEAYRRAERMERIAREKADRLYHQANGALADATVLVDEAANQIGLLSGQVMEQLTLLQEAVAGSKQALADASATLYTISAQPDQL